MIHNSIFLTVKPTKLNHKQKPDNYAFTILINLIIHEQELRPNLKGNIRLGSSDFLSKSDIQDYSRNVISDVPKKRLGLEQFES